MVKLSKRTLSVVLTLLMVISMISFSGLTASAATTQTTVETSAGIATYIVRMGTMSNGTIVGAAMGTLTYPTAKLTLDSATVSADFGTKSENTTTAGTIKWNAVGDVSYAANKAVLTVNFKIKDGQTVTAADFVGSEWQLVTKASASADPVFATDGTGLIEEIGLPPTGGDDDPLELKDSTGYKLQEETMKDGTKIKVLMGVMPKTSVANFKKLFKNSGVKVLQNEATSNAEVTSGNVKTGFRVQNSSGTDTWYVAVRGDITASGTCGGLDKSQLVKALAGNPTEYFGRGVTTLGTCKFLAAASLNAYNNLSVSGLDKPYIVAYISKGEFTR